MKDKILWAYSLILHYCGLVRPSLEQEVQAGIRFVSHKRKMNTIRAAKVHPEGLHVLLHKRTMLSSFVSDPLPNGTQVPIQ